MKVGQIMIQDFINKMIVKEVQEDDIIYYYTEKEEPLAETILLDGFISNVTFFDPKPHPFSTSEEKQHFLSYVQKVFEREHLVLDEIIDFDSHYMVLLTLREPRYNIPVHSTGMNLTIGKNGTLEEVSFSNEQVHFAYPEKLISKDQAKVIIQQQQLMTLSIRPDIGWHYVYAPDFNLVGVETDGKVRYMTEMPEMEGACFEPLPTVEAVADLKVFLIAGRNATLDVYETEDMKSWEIFSDEEEKAVAGNPLEKACIALRTIVGDEYNRFYLEKTPNLHKALGIEIENDLFKSYRFVYMNNNISLDFLATEVIVNTETSNIQSINHSLIPYEKFKNLRKQSISYKEANAIAQRLVDVDLALERQHIDSIVYSFVYLIDYPSSPTKGHIHYIDAWTGEVYFVETGFQ